MASHLHLNDANGTNAPVGMQKYMGPSLFQPHRARQAIRDAHEKKIPCMIGYYAGLSSLPITRFLAPMGYDIVWIDWEHTSCGVETMTSVRVLFCFLFRFVCQSGILWKKKRPANEVSLQMVHEAMFMSAGRTIPFVRYVLNLRTSLFTLNPSN
jgi:hypothetical protein